jgi:hypothetical protein
MNINNATEELQKIFRKFNEIKFNNELDDPILIIQTQGKKAAGGWCTAKKVWTNKEKTEFKFEITVCAEYLTKGIEHICNVILHEMVHLWQLQNDIKGCSNGNVYHNKKYKNEAINRGLNVDHAEIIGWSMTSLNDDTKELIKSFNIDENAFEWFRLLSDDLQDKENKPKKKRQSHQKKYTCPVCEAEIKSKDKIKALCIECNVAFEPEEPEDEEDDENDLDDE